MSTSFEVYPKEDVSISVLAVRERAQELIDCYLARNNLEKKLVLEAWLDNGVAARNPHIDNVTIKNSRSIFWGFKNTNGYFYSSCHDNEYELEAWEETIFEDELSDNQATIIRACLSVGWHISVERTAGNGQDIRLLYGFVAAAIAEMSGGFVSSVDDFPGGEAFSAREFIELYRT